MRFTEYICLPSFNNVALILSEKSCCDIRMDVRTDGRTDGRTDRQTDRQT